MPARPSMKRPRLRAALALARAQRELADRPDYRERRAKLVGDLGGEALRVS